MKLCSIEIFHTISSREIEYFRYCPENFKTYIRYRYYIEYMFDGMDLEEIPFKFRTLFFAIRDIKNSMGIIFNIIQ